MAVANEVFWNRCCFRIMLYEESFKNNDFCQVIRNILYMDEEKKLITYFSYSELHTIGTTENGE